MKDDAAVPILDRESKICHPTIGAFERAGSGLPSPPAFSGWYRTTGKNSFERFTSDALVARRASINADPGKGRTQTMTETLFSSCETVRYEGPNTQNPLAYRWYDANRVVLGKPLKDHLRFAVAYWHSLAMQGSDPFGSATMLRPWFAPGDPIAQAKVKADAAFELFRVLDLPFFCWHDADIAPAGDNLADTLKNFQRMVDYLEEKMRTYSTRLLWGTANLFSHPRFMAGASTNPDPEVFAWCAATVKNCMDATKRLGGSNYVLWGGREGYETLLNTDMKQELEHMGRFLTLVVDYKHKIGFQGQILIEPKPKEPTAHQYDFDYPRFTRF